jgi:Ser/Thr protein kinase RdoA (MazF antagonist)
MTDDRDFKQLVRQRMAATGETYTAARAALRAPSDQPPASGTTIADFQRLHTRTAIDRVPEHLANQYGVEVRWSVQLDVGVLRVELRNAPSWIVRVFPSLRPRAAAEREAALLRRLQARALPAERCPAGVEDPVSMLDGQPVLVTEAVEGADGRHDTTEATAHALGSVLGRVHAIPLDELADLDLPEAGAWHVLSVGGGGRQADVAALRTLLATRGRPSAPLLRTLESLDDGSGLPTALIHPDPCSANAIVSPEGGPVLIDWTGAGRGPRLLSLANLLIATGNLASVDAAVDGYRRSIELTPDELDRLPGLLVGFPTILACWSHLFQDLPLDAAVAQQALAEKRAPVIAERVRRAWAHPRAAVTADDDRPAETATATLF